MTAARVTRLYDLMDSAYDAPEIAAHSRALGHVPRIEPASAKRRRPSENPRRGQAAEADRPAPAEPARYQQRSAAERAFANFHDNLAGRMIRVRGPDKLACHVMFGLLALSAIPIMRLVQSPPRRLGRRPATPAKKSRENETAAPKSSHSRPERPPRPDSARPQTRNQPPHHAAQKTRHPEPRILQAAQLSLFSNLE